MNKLHTILTTKPITFDLVHPELPQVEMTMCKNIIILPKGYIAPRTPGNLKKLHRYVKRKFGKNMYDRRTKAYRYMVMHDSEFLTEASHV